MRTRRKYRTSGGLQMGILSCLHRHDTGSNRIPDFQEQIHLRPRRQSGRCCPTKKRINRKAIRNFFAEVHFTHPSDARKHPPAYLAFLHQLECRQRAPVCRRRLDWFTDLRHYHRHAGDYHYRPLTEPTRETAYRSDLHHCIFRYLLLGSLRTGRCFTHLLCRRTDRPPHRRMGNASCLLPVIQPYHDCDTGPYLCSSMVILG